MIYLIASILLATFLFVIFKLFAQFKVNVFQAIVVNYVIASICGLVSYTKPFTVNKIIEMPWFTGAFLLGILFVFIFYIMALTAQQNGLSVASVAAKMSVVVPIVFAVLVYGEKLSIIKITGIIMAIAAVYLVSVKEDGINIKKGTLLYPVLLFLGSGTIDTSLKYLEVTYVNKGEIPLFSATIFAFAALVGFIVLTFKILYKKEIITGKNLIAGIFLGVFNYYSISFLIMTLKTDTLDSSTVFTINNVAIVTLTTLMGILLFKEKLNTNNKVGIFIAVLSIFLVAMSH